MKCANCGKELKVGCIYCESCGKAVQLVPDYNVLEEDLLYRYIEEEKERPVTDTLARAGIRKRKGQKDPTKRWVFLGFLVCLLCVCVTGIRYKIRYDHEHSFEWQFQMGEKSAEDRNYKKAISYYEKALFLNTDYLDTRFRLATLYEQVKKKAKAKEMLKEVMIYDPDNLQACQELIRLYAEDEEYDAIVGLREKATTEEMQDLFIDYEVDAPEVSKEEGTYNEYIELELYSFEENARIYYTLDGTDPKENGMLYQGKIQLNHEKLYSLRAVVQDARGIYSAEMVSDYNIDRKAPDRPLVQPQSGTYNSPQTIRIRVPEGASAYYTWDGNEPTTESTRYDAPFAMWVGNNILSVIIVDRQGVKSPVARFNYIYYGN